MNLWDYIRNFLRDRNVAALAPTSHLCVKAIVDHLDLEGDQVVVEYGPGDGAVSRELLHRLSPASRLIMVESNEAFCRELSCWKDKRITLVQGKAQDIEGILQEQGVCRVDQVLSGIPFSYLTGEDQQRILNASWRVLPVEGRMIAYQLTARLRPELEKRFENVREDRCWSYLHPLCILVAEGKKRQE